MGLASYVPSLSIQSSSVYNMAPREKSCQFVSDTLVHFLSTSVHLLCTVSAFRTNRRTRSGFVSHSYSSARLESVLCLNFFGRHVVYIRTNKLFKERHVRFQIVKRYIQVHQSRKMHRDHTFPFFDVLHTRFHD